LAAEEAGDYRKAYGYWRDGTWYTVAFLACMRKEEATALEKSDITISPAIKGAYNIRIRRSKTHSVAKVIPIQGETRSGINLKRILKGLLNVRKKLQVPNDAPWFGNMNNPLIKLKSASSILERLNSIYFDELSKRGLHTDEDFRLSGHSFRRGGINAIRDAARDAGISDEELKLKLLTFGRWKNEKSVLVYLVENWLGLAQLTQRI